MLRNLSVKNFAIVDRVELEFDPGFNVLTGETGAGKSLLVDALSFLMGEKLDPDVLRSGEDKAVAEALFQVASDGPAAKLVSEWGLEASQGEILLRREYSRSSGKTKSTLNGSLVTAAMVAELSGRLVDLHGQHEHQAIFNVGLHRRLVDSFGRLEGELQKTASAHKALAALLDERVRLGGDARDAARRQDLLSFQVGELESSGLDAMDEETLTREYQAARHAGRISEFLALAQEALEGPGGGATGQSGEAVARLGDAAKLDPSLEALLEKGRVAQEELQQVSFELSRKLEEVGHSEGRFQELSDQIDLLHTLKKKYGDTLDEVRAYLESARNELRALEGRDERLQTIQKEIESASEQYRAAASTLNAKRLKAGGKLSAEVMKLLGDLGLPGARLEVKVEGREDPGSPVTEKGRAMAVFPSGWDLVEFQFSANAGEPMRPLSKVASGGEASRVLLALKAVLAGSDEVPTLVSTRSTRGWGPAPPRRSVR